MIVTAYQKPRVAVLITSMAGGGAERAVAMLLSHIDSKQYEVHLIVNRFEGPYCSAIPAHVQISEMRSPRLRQALPKLIRVLNQIRPDVLISNLWENNVMAVMARKWCKHPFAVAVCEHSAISRKRPPGTNMFRRLGYQRADAVIGCSAAMGEELHRLLAVPKSIIHVIYNPILDDQFESRREEICLHPWLSSRTGSERHGQAAIHDGSRHNPYVVVGIGRLSPEKRYDLLIHSVIKLQQSGIHVKAIIIGEGADRSRLEQIIADHKAESYIDMPGYSHNPLPYLRCADMYVQSSDVEGLPTALIEAVACGTPVVATLTATGTAEVLEGVDAARTVPCGDIDAMANAIKEQLTQHYRLTAAVNDTIQTTHHHERYSAGYAALQYENVINKLLSQRGKTVQISRSSSGKEQRDEIRIRL